MNALSLELLERLADAWVNFRDDDEAWVAIITGAGDKAFCTGFDLVDQAERDKKGEGVPLTLPRGHALEIALWGDRRISAERGYEIGWINRVVPKDNLMDEAMSWAERMLYLAPQCVRNLKQIIYRSYDMASSDAEAFANALERNLLGMEDTVEGVRAFAEKRKPVFKNK